MDKLGNIERISLYPNDVPEEKRAELLRFLRERNITFSYEAY